MHSPRLANLPGRMQALVLAALAALVLMAKIYLEDSRRRAEEDRKSTRLNSSHT